MCSEKQQRANPDGMMRVYENRRRCTPTANFLQQFAVNHLGKTASAVFHWRGRTKHTDAPQPIDDVARDICLSIYLGGVEMFAEKLAELDKSFIQLGLLRCRDAWIRHHPIRDEIPLEKPLGKTNCLRTGEKQFLRLLNFLLPCFDFVHKKFAAEDGGHAL